MDYHYRIYVFLAGETRMLLCTVESPEAVGSVLVTLCRADHPEYTRIEVEMTRPLPGG